MGEQTPVIRVRQKSSGKDFDYAIQAVTSKLEAVSFWHDVPLHPPNRQGRPMTNLVNFISEIPKSTRKKFEVSTKTAGNPIKQDVKNGKLREYSKGDVFFNYGCIPQTWEDPDFVHPDVGVGGDGDPLDACEIGLRMIPTGTVRPTKVLGVICMIDEGEADWKLVVIDSEDPWAAQLNDISDVEQLLPGTLDQIREWWRTYKISDGKPSNRFGLNEMFLDRKYANEVIREMHESWKKSFGQEAQGDANMGKGKGTGDEAKGEADEANKAKAAMAGA